MKMLFVGKHKVVGGMFVFWLLLTLSVFSSESLEENSNVLMNTKNPSSISNYFLFGEWDNGKEHSQKIKFHIHENGYGICYVATSLWKEGHNTNIDSPEFLELPLKWKRSESGVILKFSVSRSESLSYDSKQETFSATSKLFEFCEGLDVFKKVSKDQGVDILATLNEEVEKEKKYKEIRYGMTEETYTFQRKDDLIAFLIENFEKKSVLGVSISKEKDIEVIYISNDTQYVSFLITYLGKINETNSLHGYFEKKDIKDDEIEEYKQMDIPVAYVLPENIQNKVESWCDILSIRTSQWGIQEEGHWDIKKILIGKKFDIAKRTELLSQSLTFIMDTIPMGTSAGYQLKLYKEKLTPEKEEEECIEIALDRVNTLKCGKFGSIKVIFINEDVRGQRKVRLNKVFFDIVEKWNELWPIIEGGLNAAINEKKLDLSLADFLKDRTINLHFGGFEDEKVVWGIAFDSVSSDVERIWFILHENKIDEYDIIFKDSAKY